MFCPYCGSQMADDTVFCTSCGKQIGGGNPTLAAQNQRGGPAQKKLVIIAAAIVCLIAVVAVIVLLSGNSESKQDVADKQSTGGEKTPSSGKGNGADSIEGLIDALFAAAYSKDVEAVVALYPKEMESHAKGLFNGYRGGSSKFTDYLPPSPSLFKFIDLNTGNEYSYEFVRAVNIDTEELMNDKNYIVSIESLQEDFGLTVDEIYQVQVRSMGVWRDAAGNRNSDGVRGYLEVARIGNRWYLVQGDDLWLSAWME